MSSLSYWRQVNLPDVIDCADGEALYKSSQLLRSRLLDTTATMIYGARRRVEYEGPSNSKTLGTKTVKYVENYTCYSRPNAGMLVHVRINVLKVHPEQHPAANVLFTKEFKFHCVRCVLPFSFLLCLWISHSSTYQPPLSRPLSTLELSLHSRFMLQSGMMQHYKNTCPSSLSLSAGFIFAGGV